MCKLFIVVPIKCYIVFSVNNNKKKHCNLIKQCILFNTKTWKDRYKLFTMGQLEDI